MNLDALIAEMRARLELGTGSASLLLAVVPTDVMVDELRPLLVSLLQATPLEVADLGRCSTQTGPARWVDAVQEVPAAVHVISFASSGPLEARAFGQLLNTERGLLAGLSGPLVLMVSRQTERALREHAHDFFTWIAHGYELPEPRSLRAEAERQGVGGALEPEPQPPEEPIRFLHLSDLHLRPSRGARYDANKVLRGLVQFLEEDRQRFPLDLVFVTGDLAFQGKAEEYELVLEFFERLLAVTGVPKERLFVVPGNHDVDRNVGRWLLRTLEDSDQSVEFFDTPDGRALHMQKFQAYREAMSRWLGNRSLGLDVGGDAVEIVEVRGARLAVASFNSAWFSQDDGDDGKLWIGEPNVKSVVDRIADEGAEFAVALLHHPFKALHEQDLVEHWFERGIDVVLRGHLHNDRTQVVTSQRGGYLEVAAPAAYQGSKWANGCFLGEIRPKARTVRLRPLGYAAGPDPWVLDTKVFPDDASDGYCRSFTVPPKQRMRSGMAAPLRAAVEEAYKKAPVHQQRLARDIVQRSKKQRTKASRNVDQQALRALEESPSFREEIFGQHTALALVAALEDVEQERIEITDATSFASALLKAGKLLARKARELRIPWEILDAETLEIGLAASIGALVEAPVAVSSPGARDQGYDILVGRGSERDAIQIRRTRSASEEHRRRWIDHALVPLARGAFRHVALVVFSESRALSTPVVKTSTKTAGGVSIVLVQIEL